MRGTILRSVIGLSALALAAACTHSLKDTRHTASKVFVSGTAYACGTDALGLARPARGETIRLVAGELVLAEDVVAIDGRFVLHPHQSDIVTGPMFVVAGTRRISLANEYASWLQDNLSWSGDVTFG